MTTRREQQFIQIGALQAFSCSTWRWLRYAVHALLLVFLGATSAHADVQYVYDNAGRLVQVIAADGSSAKYQYDAAGNILAIERIAAGQLALGAFNPMLGAPGATVSIQGSGFSTTPSANAVSFNGAAATVISASANQLSVQVPVAATTGPISVTVGGNTVSSAESFSVVAVPAISGFTPTVVNIGDTVTVSGTNFNPIPGSTMASVAGVSTILGSISATQLTFATPSRAVNSPITVATPYGQASSAARLIVMPSTIAAADVVASADPVAGGSAQSLNFSGNKYGVLAFDATEGQYLSLQINSLTTTPSGAAVPYRVFSPSNVQIASGTVSSTGIMSIHLPRAAATGGYLVVFTSGTSPVQLSAALEVNAVVGVGSAPLSASTVGVHQSKRFVMPAGAGQYIGVGLANTALTPNSGSLSLSVTKPDGASFGGVGCAAAGGSSCGFSLLDLPLTGDYLITVTAPVASTVSFDILASQAVSGTLTAGTPLNLSLPRVGQFAMLDFTASAGQTVALNIGSIATTPSQPVYFAVRNASGTVVKDDNPTTAMTFNLTDLAAGTYKVQVSPYYGGTATAQVKLASGVTATVPTNATSSSYSTTLVGQTAYFTFAATAGQNIGIGFTNMVVTPNLGMISFAITKPDGTALNSTGCNPAGGSTCGLSLINLPQTGNYLITVTPPGLSTMSFNLWVSQAVSGTLTPGTQMSLSLVAGQFAMYDFTATAGQTSAFRIESIVTTPSQPVLIAVYNPAGTQIQNPSISTATTLNLPNLAAGTYKVQVTPHYGGVATAQVKFAAGVTATVSANGTAGSYSTSVVGQNAYFTFAATAGQNIGVGLGNMAVTPNSGRITFSVSKPDGSALNSSGCSASGGSRCGLSLVNLPQTGNYLVTVVPPAGTTMSFDLVVSQAVSSTLTVGTPLSLTLAVPGQFAMLNFTATAGQSLTLSLSSIATSPTQSVLVAVYNSSGTQISNTTGSTSASLNLTNLAAGSYKVQVTPFYGGTATAQVSLN